MKLLNIFFILLFLFSAVLQYNDPDPVVWMTMYLYGAALCLLSLRGRYFRWLFITGLVVYVGYAIYLLFGENGVLSWIREHEAESIVQSMKADKPWIEETREFFGLLFLISALLVNMIWRKTTPPAAL